jgi:hypothetical protein
MKKFLLYNLLSIISFTTLGQIWVVDTLNNPIPFVQISSNKHNLGYSDLEGKVSDLKLDMLEKDDTIKFNHIAFQQAKLSKATYKIHDTIVLIPKAYSLSTVDVLSDVPKYQIIKACYRSKVYVNGLLAYISEGKIDYLLKSKNGKFKGLRIKDFISHQNKDIKSLYNKYKTEVGVSNASIPIPNIDKLPYQYKKKFDLHKVKDGENAVQLVSDDKILVGTIDFNDGLLEYNLDDYFNQSDRKLLRTRIIYKSLSYNMFFSQSKDFDEIFHSDFNNLLYQMSTFNYSLQHKREANPKEIFAEYEIFIEEVNYTDEYKKENYKDGTGMPVGKSRVKDSWDDCSCKVYSTLDSNFLMKNNMEL